MSRDVFTVQTEWKRDETDRVIIRPITQFLGHEPVHGAWEPLITDTRGMSNEQISELALQGIMLGVHLLERTLPIRYVSPEEFEKLVGEKES